MKDEFQQQLEEEKKKSGEIAKKTDEELLRRAEAIEKMKDEFQRQLEEEKKKSGEIAHKADEELRKEAQRHEALTREVEELCSRALALGEKIRELEASLKEKTSLVEQLGQQKEGLTRQSEKVAAEAQHELAALRSREQEFLRKIEGLERNVQEMTESLRSRDRALDQLEKQILEITEIPLSPKTKPAGGQDLLSREGLK